MYIRLYTILLSLFFCFILQIVNAQSRQIDSLLNRLEYSDNKRDSLKTSNDLALVLGRSYPDSAMKYAKLAKKLAFELNDLVEIAEYYKSKGNIFYRINELDSALAQYQNALDIYDELNDTLGKAKIHNNIGALRRAKGDYYESLRQYQMSLDLRVMLNDRSGMGKTYNNMGNLQYQLGEIDKALEYFDKSLKIRKEFNDEHGIAGCYTNMGLIFIEKGKYDSAISIFGLASDIYNSLEDIQGLANCYTSLGLAYMEMGAGIKAKNNFNKALSLYEKIGNKRAVSLTFSQIAEIFNNSNSYDSAFYFAHKALSVSERYNTIVEKSDAYKQLSIALEGLNRHKEAFDYYKQHVKLEDSLYNLDRIKEVKMIEEKYQSENQKLEISKLEAENKLNEIQLEKLNNRQIISIIGIAIALIFIINLLINRNRLKSKNTTIQEQNKKISKQKFEIERHRNHLEELVRERTKDLKEAKDKAEESDRLKTSFLTNMSHEIRTPMNAIMGFTELLNSGDPSETERIQYRKFIESNSELLLRLMDDIIDLAKIESGQITINNRPTDLKDIMERIRPIFHKKQQQSEKEDIEIIDEITPCKTRQLVNADPIRIQQILTNLIDNALKFTDKGYIKISCSPEEIDNKRYALVQVEDTGIGMTKEQLSIIFQRFGKIEENRKKVYRGAGLGLAISKNLIELMGGEIWVTSEESRGTTFTLRLPVIES